MTTIIFDKNNKPQSIYFSEEEMAKAQMIYGKGLYNGYEEKATGKCFLNLSQVGSILNKTAQSVSDFYKSEDFKEMYGKALLDYNFSLPNKGGVVKLIDTNAVTYFLQYWGSKGDQTAISVICDLARQNLNLKVKSNLQEDEELQEELEQILEEKEEKEEKKDFSQIYENFQSHCNRKGWDAEKVYNYINVVNFGVYVEEVKYFFPENKKLKNQGVENYGPYMFEFLKLNLEILTGFYGEEEEAIKRTCDISLGTLDRLIKEKHFSNAVKRTCELARAEKGSEFCEELDKEIEFHKKYKKLVKEYEIQLREFHPRRYELTEEEIITLARQLTDDYLEVTA